ncbi:MAG: hypothetical protein WBZ40_04910 [Acidimicrobiia bacterium]
MSLRIRPHVMHILIRAIFNTFPLATALIFEVPQAAVIANLALWGVLIYLRKTGQSVNLHSRSRAER